MGVGRTLGSTGVRGVGGLPRQVPESVVGGTDGSEEEHEGEGSTCAKMGERAEPRGALGPAKRRDVAGDPGEAGRDQVRTPQAALKGSDWILRPTGRGRTAPFSRRSKPGLLTRVWR